MKPVHALVSCLRDGSMKFVARCKCGYESVPSSDKHGAQIALIQHIRDETKVRT